MWPCAKAPFLHVPSTYYFCITVATVSDRSKLRKERFILTENFCGFLAPVVRKACCRGTGVVGTLHIVEDQEAESKARTRAV